jgi:hypothetical protein
MRKSSLVDMARRRAASDALSSSVDIGPSLVEAKFTTQNLNLTLDLGEHGEVVGLDEDVPAVLKPSQQVQRLIEVEDDALRSLGSRGPHS